MNGSNGTANNSYAECIEWGSICLHESKFRIAMESGIYFMKIDDKHQFTMICEPEPHPTAEPTDPLTTDSPTLSPSTNPTEDPTTSYPTEQVIVVNVSFDGIPMTS